MAKVSPTLCFPYFPSNRDDQIDETRARSFLVLLERARRLCYSCTGWSVLKLSVVDE